VTTANDPPVILSSTVVVLARVTYRQLDFWVRRGWLEPTSRPGSGHVRTWTLDELAVACRMGALVEVGITAERAAHVAREGWVP
jgi:DNA-binding transcriptional MerR regulator